MAARKKTPPAAPIRPFLKWAGNKYRILHEVKKYLPEKGKRLNEPFVGSGAVFLNTDFDSYLLYDANQDLIDVYNFLKQEGQTFIDNCRPLFDGNNNADAYYRLRDEFNSSSDRYRRATLFVYLNRHGYNGLCRYNSKGGFNVPFGQYKKPYFPEKEMHAFHHKAKHATFKTCDFVESFKSARRGDVIYCDPPYAPLSDTANFTSYSTGGFSLEQQTELAKLANHSVSRGITVLISNHDTPYTRSAYNQAELHHFHVQRYISCNGKKRGMAGELLARFSPGKD